MRPRPRSRAYHRGSCRSGTRPALEFCSKILVVVVVLSVDTKRLRKIVSVAAASFAGMAAQKFVDGGAALQLTFDPHGVGGVLVVLSHKLFVGGVPNL